MTDQDQRIQRLNAARAAIDQKRHDEALAILKEFPPGVPESTRAEQLRGLALARKGELEEAQRVLGTLYESGQRDPNTGQLDSETMGIYARTWMDRYAKSRDPEHLRKSRDLYADAFKRWPDDSYVGLNAAAKSVLLDEIEDAKKYIKVVDALVAQDYAKRLDDLKQTKPSDAY